MENISLEYLPAEKGLMNINQLNHQLLNVDSELNKPNMTSSHLVQSPESNDYNHAYIKHSNDHQSQNDNICLESDEYDSDCSLGSLNSLYLRLKNNSNVLNSYKTDRVSTKQLQPTICNLSKANSSSGNYKVTKTKTSEKIMAYDNTEDTKPIMKLNTTLFYGKQKSTSQHIFTQLSYEHSFKKIVPNSKILKTRPSVSTFKYNIKKLRISSKKLKQRRRPTIQKTLSSNNIFWENKNLIRSHLKEAVPLLQFTAKCMKKNVQNNELFSWKNTDENLLQNKIELIKDECIIKKEDNESLETSYMENQLYEPNYFFINDFTDTDDFGGTIEIENIIQTLDEDDSCIDIETHKWWKNEYDYEEDQDEIQDKFCILFKKFNNL